VTKFQFNDYFKEELLKCFPNNQHKSYSDYENINKAKLREIERKLKSNLRILKNL
jgi:hypothetical protein